MFNYFMMRENAWPVGEQTNGTYLFIPSYIYAILILVIFILLVRYLYKRKNK